MSRIVVDIASNDILQVEKTPDEGELRGFNGKYAIPIPPGASVDVDIDSYVLPQDGGDIATQAAAALLARFPMYSNIVYNFLLEPADVLDIDPAGVGPSSEIPRYMTGRGSGAGSGQVPNTTVLLDRNNGATAPRAGAIITDTVDIGPVTGGAGADEFMLWWHFYKFSSSSDVAADFGLFSGVNNPATKSIIEIDQEPGSINVFISHDDGVTWTAINRLEPTDLGVFDTDVRLAFINEGGTRFNLAAYAFMF